MAEAISDAAVERTLSVYAALAARLLDDPEAWLGDDEPAPAEPPARLRRLGSAVRDRLAGDVNPGSPGWSQLPAAQRSEWWVDRVAALASPVAATPRFFGAAADRLPLQAALGAAAQGLAVCAVAREHGVDDPDAWVPLLGKVLLDRDLSRGRTAEAQADVEAAAAAEPEGEPGTLRRGSVAVWRLARSLLGLWSLFDARPRGRLVYQALGKLPVVGLVGGVLDERGGVRRAAEETAALLATGR